VYDNVKLLVHAYLDIKNNLDIFWFIVSCQKFIGKIIENSNDFGSLFIFYCDTYFNLPNNIFKHETLNQNEKIITHV